MLFREGENNQIPQVRVEFERSGADLVVRSVYVGNRRQIAKKMADKRKVLDGIGLGGQSLDSLSVADYLAALGDRSSRPESSSDNSPDAQDDGTAGGGTGQLALGFAGARAATADTMAMTTAQGRLAAREDAEAMRRATGWHKGVDGRWRFEISDNNASLTMSKADAFNFIETIDGVTVGDLVAHPALFSAYPELATLSLSLKSGKGASLAKATANGKSVSPEIMLGRDIGQETILSVLLHEIQHGVQNIEGFATGGSIEAAAVDMPTPQAMNDAKVLAARMNRGDSCV